MTRSGRASPGVGTVRAVSSTLLTSLARSVVAAREFAGLTQAEVAARTGWSAKTVWRIENEQRPIHVDELPELCTALGCTLFDLLARASARDRRALGLHLVRPVDE